jgi:hypothetical protein
MRHLRRAGLATLLLASSCSTGPDLPPAIPEGTWGGDDAGLLLSASTAHVHVGCSAGNFGAPIPVGGDGRFTAEGRYSHMRELYPFGTGQSHPATLSGRLDSEDRLTFTVRVTDDGEVYGPVEVRLGVEPAMQNCPICRLPEAETAPRADPLSAFLLLSPVGL